LVPDGERSAEHPATKDGPRPVAGLSARQALRSASFWTLTMAGGIDQLAAMVIAAHQIASMVARGFDPVLAAGIAGLIGVASLPGRFLLNLFSDRFGPQRLLATILTVLALGVAVFALARSLTWLYAYVVVYGIAFGTRSPLRASVMAEHFGRRAYGAITAIQGVVIAIPAAAGPLAAGWLYDTLGNYQLALWLTAGAFLIAALLVVATPEP
jgi:MFS family permease